MFLLVSLPALNVKTPKLLLITPLLQHYNSRSASVFSVVLYPSCNSIIISTKPQKGSIIKNKDTTTGNRRNKFSYLIDIQW